MEFMAIKSEIYCFQVEVKEKYGQINRWKKELTKGLARIIPNLLRTAGRRYNKRITHELHLLKCGKISYGDLMLFSYRGIVKYSNKA